MSVLRSRRVTVPAAVLLLLGGVWWLSGAATGEDDGEWAEVARDDLVRGIEVTGKLRAVETTQLGPPQVKRVWEYKISYLAPEGEEVPEGTPVLGFDTTELMRRLERQQAERDGAIKQIEKTEQDLTMARRQDAMRLAEAEARRRKAGLKVERPGELSSARELAEARLDLELADKELAYLARRLEASERSADATLGALRAQKERAEQQTRELEEAVEKMMVKAPRAGTVIYVTDWREEKKKVGDSCWRGNLVIELPDLSVMQAEGQVDEADAGQLVEGQEVTLRLDAHPDVPFRGRVSSIWKTVQPKSWRSPLKVARLEIELEETDTKKMRPGMRFRGTVETERVEDALLIPARAVFLSAEGPVVYRRTMFGYKAVAVDLGRRDEERVEVLDGLRLGDRISLVDLEAQESRS